MTADYYGTKRVTAWPQLSDAPPPMGGKEGYAVKYADGYISWSPKDVFEAAYQPITGMDFGRALQAMRDGHRVARQEWAAGWSLRLAEAVRSSHRTPGERNEDEWWDVVDGKRFIGESPNGALDDVDNLLEVWEILGTDWMIVPSAGDEVVHD